MSRGRPQIGPELKFHVPREMLWRLDVLAHMRRVPRAVIIREVLEAGLAQLDEALAKRGIRLDGAGGGQ